MQQDIVFECEKQSQSESVSMEKSNENIGSKFRLTKLVVKNF